jgi:hypothetical protein
MELLRSIAICIEPSELLLLNFDEMPLSAIAPYIDENEVNLEIGHETDLLTQMSAGTSVDARNERSAVHALELAGASPA